MFKTSRLERAGFAARRSVVMARNGMVATSQPLATEAGVAILKKGGNAFDAAIATALTLGVVEPMSTNIGGDAFLLYRWAADGKIYGVNGSGRCPQHLTLDALRRRGIQGVPRYGWGSVTVPGAIDAFVEVQRRHGKLTFAEVLAPAIYYASEGFPVSEVIAQQWRAAVPVLSQFPSSAQTYLVDGQAPQAGDVHRQPNLARTLQLLASEGKEAFYRGDIARRIVQFSQATGGFLTLEDLASHTTEWVEPLRTDYRGYSVLELPPNGQGNTAYVTCVDSERNVVSLIHSLFESISFGSGLVAGDTGICLHNRGAGFVADPAHPNALVPGKRPFHTIIPAMILKDERPWLCYGVMGGDMQVQGHVQVALNMIDFAMNVQEAIEAPRYRIMGGRRVALERAISPAVRDALAAMGHVLTPYGDQSISSPNAYGGGHAILIDEQRGVLQG